LRPGVRWGGLVEPIHRRAIATRHEVLVRAHNVVPLERDRLAEPHARSCEQQNERVVAREVPAARREQVRGFRRS